MPVTGTLLAPAVVEWMRKNDAVMKRGFAIGFAADLEIFAAACGRDLPKSRCHVFCGTRVPVQTLLDYLEAGDSIDEFLAGFPSVTREQVIDFLEAAKDRLVETVV